MIYFNSDYLEGAHPAIMERLLQTNMEQTVGYGEDEYCAAAREKIKAACRAPEADVHFLVGGTLTNTTVIASVLRPYQGVLTAASGHINCHETGAIESSGHKVLALPTNNGKITAQQVEDYYNWHHFNPDYEHMVMPGMVYISFPTEGGTLYSKAELTALYQVCQKCGLPLFIDGARMGYGLTCDDCDLTLPELARLCDVFYIGGNKVGALFGEAVVIMNPALKRDFRFMMKQRGGMLAKGRLLGEQFLALLDGEDGTGNSLYFTLAAEADRQAMAIRKAFEEKGVKLLHDSYTNQQFFVLPDEWHEVLSKDFAMTHMGKPDKTHTAVRICTSWATKAENVETLIEAVKKL